MQDNIIRRIHQVLGSGLELLERIENNERPQFQTEHNKLLDLLVSGGELDYNPIYNGELGTAAGRATTVSDMNSKFFGVRYALACWLDEIFLRPTTPAWWLELWEQDTMEVRLYGGTQQRAWRFWDQALKAEGPRGSPEALEAYLWCVMLGFRGQPTSPNIARQIHPPTWVENVRKRILAARSTEFPTTQQRELPTYVPALRWSDRFVTMLRVALVVGAAASFAVSLTLIKYLSR